MGKINSRNKGASFERLVANLLKEFDSGAKRNVAECQEASVDIVTALPFGVQCKRTKDWTTHPTKSYAQARGGSVKVKKLVPLVVHKVDQVEPFAILSLADFLMLLRLLRHLYFGARTQAPDQFVAAMEFPQWLERSLELLQQDRQAVSGQN